MQIGDRRDDRYMRRLTSARHDPRTLFVLCRHGVVHERLSKGSCSSFSQADEGR